MNPGVGTGLPHSILAWAQDCHTQSWRGHRIATLNPGVGTGLPHSILAWAQDCPTQSWRGHRIALLPGIARPRLPGIGACSLPSPRQGRDSSYRGRDSDFALHRGRFSDFAVASDFARKILRKRCGGERIASGVGFHPENPITGPAPEVRQRGCPRGTADGVFFSPFTRPAVNPGVGTGLPHSILAWAQDCHTQSWRGHRIATLNPGVATGMPRCITSSSGLELFFPERRLVMESAPL